jgi:membrane fusion protein (multidrug efflux system)
VTAVPVEVVEILPGSISAFIETNGTLEAEREVDIVARTGGPLVALNTEEGVQVSAGDLLAQIDEAEARAQVEISRVALQDAEMVYNRAKASLENAVVSQEVYDTALSALESAKAQLAGNEIQLGYTRITAPFDGLIIQRAVKFGETVTAGQQVFRISDFDPLLCVIGVPERDLARLSVGQPAALRVEAFPGEQFQGRVLRISPVVDAATGTIRVTIAVDRQGRLSPGMFAGVRLVTDVRQDALIMPKRALSLESLADSVFVVEDGVAYRRNVTLGYEEDDRVQVTDGLARGDRVIVVGQDGLTDATPVQILVGPGAEEAAPRRAAAAGGSGMTEERRTAMRERMRARGMTDEQIEERLSAMESRDGAGGRAGGPGAAPPADARPSGGRPAPAAPESPAPAAADVPQAAPAPSAEANAAAAPGPAAARSRGAGAQPGPGSTAAATGPGSFDSLPPETQEAIKGRLRSMGLTDEQIEERIQRGWGPAAAAEDAGNAPPTAEQLDALRERLRERGMTEEQIEEIIARRRRPQP